MEQIIQPLNLVLITIGALLGSVKASVELDCNKAWCARTVDIFVGVFVGIFIAQHLGSQYSVWFSGLIALIGGTSGTLILEVILQMVPGLTKKVIKSLFPK